MNALTWAVFGHLDLQIDRNDALSVFYFLFQFYTSLPDLLPPKSSADLLPGFAFPDSQVNSNDILAAVSLLCAARVFLFIRTVRHVGVLCLSIIAMWKDIFTWSILLIACFGSFLLSWIFTLRGLEHDEEDIEAQEKGLDALVWAVFGHLDLDIADRNDAFPVFYFVFQFYVAVLLINLLIAMMGNTFARVWDNSVLEYKSSRVLLKEQYIKLPILPPPLNLFCIPSKCLLLLFYFCTVQDTQHGGTDRQLDAVEHLKTVKIRQVALSRYIEAESIDSDTMQPMDSRVSDVETP
eukprot:CAMPEP_0175815664 /NCGR_PEP_ID=MMETSP0107_2-20121207/6084_1 /TAXON_ID=195067 ORGANISM="Goniomonas pacifica, Strain CCMP1869" /NCGR_SAMPLE_ID=MMETSP0107_2 /ASSEMBLY_ACC=CAM_ASM_000203 /LENGTH=293 /DNA_ID=CAMNT_0017127715 /DNA_START=1 /DNA_END=879 /DNA_ORIENTATION=-